MNLARRIAVVFSKKAQRKGREAEDGWIESDWVAWVDSLDSLDFPDSLDFLDFLDFLDSPDSPARIVSQCFESKSEAYASFSPPPPPSAEAASRRDTATRKQKKAPSYFQLVLKELAQTERVAVQMLAARLRSFEKAAITRSVQRSTLLLGRDRSEFRGEIHFTHQKRRLAFLLLH